MLGGAFLCRGVRSYPCRPVVGAGSRVRRVLPSDGALRLPVHVRNRTPPQRSFASRNCRVQRSEWSVVGQFVRDSLPQSTAVWRPCKREVGRIANDRA